MMRAFTLGAALATSVLGASLESCGGDGDLLSGVKIALSPDPPKANKDFTLTVTGDLQAHISKGSLNSHLTIAVFGQTIDATGGTMFALSPGIPKGPQSLKLGPFKYPKLPLGVKPIINGNLTLQDSASRQISCLKFNSFPVYQAEETAPKLLSDDPVSICSKSSDHLKDVKFSSANGITTINGTLDEDVKAGQLDIDMKISINLFEDISINLNIDTPFSYTPGLKAGPLSVVLGPSKSFNPLQRVGGISGSVKGTIKANDASGQEIVCVAVDVEPSSQATIPAAIA